ncbi:IS701 family transposase [Saccharopolyspora taberi]|uniref:Transposase n=1 Tax=Saccharopolyspora taberi TaxID=60895 RepID=A0ABN3V6K5_9PSEU
MSRPGTLAPSHIPDFDHVIDELRPRLFATLRRKDQREKAVNYVRGILRAEGRKSMSNIAELLGGRAPEQAMHHFISSSTWDWRPIREALAGYLDEVLRPTVSVVTSVTIPKWGEHSVGVNREFLSEYGKVVNFQRAFCSSVATEEVSAPVDWTLFVPEAWGGERVRGRTAEAANNPAADRLLAGAALDTVRAGPSQHLPVLVDAREFDARSVLRELVAERSSWMVRVPEDFRVLPHDPKVPRYGVGPVRVSELSASVKGLARRVEWSGPGSRNNAALVVAVWVLIGDEPGRPGQPLLLLADWSEGQLRPGGFWLTDMGRETPEHLLQLAKSAARVEKDLVETGEQVGFRDFKGRSFPGWHRHMTLASVAYLVALRGRTGVLA